MADSGKVKFKCTTCGKRYALRAELAGRVVSCPCGNTVRVPTDAPPARPAPPRSSAPGSRRPGPAPQVPAAAPNPLLDLLDDDGDEPAATPTARVAGSRYASPPEPAAPPPRVARKSGGGDDGDTWKWWYYVLGGLGVILITIYEFIELGHAAEPGEEPFLARNMRGVYAIFGRWGVLVFGCLMGAFCILIGAWQRPKDEG